MAIPFDFSNNCRYNFYNLTSIIFNKQTQNNLYLVCLVLAFKYIGNMSGFSLDYKINNRPKLSYSERNHSYLRLTDS